MIELKLPPPPSANKYWRSRIQGAYVQTYVSKEAKQYKEAVGWLAREAGVRAPLLGRVRIEIDLYPQRPQDWAKRAAKSPETWDDDVRCIDLDNANKVLLDALKGIVIEDDRWVRELHSRRMEPDGEARVVLRVTQMVIARAQGALELA